MKHLFCALILFISSTVFAQNNTDSTNSFKVKFTEEEGKLVLSIENPTAKKLNILVRQHNGTVLAENAVNDVQYRCRYTFDNAADGEYTFVVQCGKEKVTRSFAIETKQVETRTIWRLFH